MEVSSGVRHHLFKASQHIRFLGRLNFSSSTRTKQNLSRTNGPIPISSYGNLNGTHQTRLKLRNMNIEIMKRGNEGNVIAARKIFDEMPERDSVSYGSMITVYLKNNELRNAERLFLKMPRKNVVAESAMIHGFVKAGRIDEARSVFDAMVERNVFSWTSLISGYFNCGQIDVGRRLFDQMPVKNVVTWTTLLLGYARNGFLDQARDIFGLMPEKNVVAWTALIKCYVENDQCDEAIKLFSEMPQRNLYSWNIMILGCLNAHRVNEAIRLFNSMPQRNAISWTTMVTGLAQNKMIEYAKEYFDQMPKKDIAAYNAMITAYVDESLMFEARELFNLMPKKNIVSWNAMIDGYAKHGPQGEGLKNLIIMLHSNFRPNETTMTSILTSCNSLVELMQSHMLLIRLGFENETSLTNALVTMYSRNGDVNSSRLAFEHLENKDFVSWTAMILGYSNHGYGHYALQVFTRMLRSGSNPDGITFVGVLSACSHAGLVRKGQKLFQSITQAYGLKPKAEHYSCLVDILGRAGQVEEAMKVVSTMPDCERDGAVLGALLGACKLYSNDKIASIIGEKLIELEPSDSGGYVLLANVYAACGKWDEFAQLRKRMKEKNVRKVPGFSQIEVMGKSHVFLVGDRSHPLADEIFEFLNEKILPMMRETS